MSIIQRSDWEYGFPFSDSKLHRNSKPPLSWLGGRLAEARINEAQILEGHAQGENSGTAPLSSRPVSRPSIPGHAIRLLPLEAFFWGNHSLPPRPRSRPDHALIWLTQGGLHLDLPRHPQRMQPGDLRWIPAGAGFAALPQEETRGHVLLIAPVLTRGLEPGFPAGPTAARIAEETAPLLALMRDLETMTRQDTPANQLSRHLGLLAMALDELALRGPGRVCAIAEQDDPALLARFQALVQAEMSEAVTVAELAQRLGCTTAALDRICMAHDGKRAIETINDMRLQRAVTLLRETRLSPMQIAARLGYASHAHFARAFASATGRRPEVFRMQGG